MSHVYNYFDRFQTPECTISNEFVNAWSLTHRRIIVINNYWQQMVFSIWKCCWLQFGFKNIPQPLKTPARVTENIIISPDRLPVKIISFVCYFLLYRASRVFVSYTSMHLFLINKSALFHKHAWHNDVMRHWVRLFEDFQQQLTVTFRNDDPRKSDDRLEIIYIIMECLCLPCRLVALTLYVLYLK